MKCISLILTVLFSFFLLGNLNAEERKICIPINHFNMVDDLDFRFNAYTLISQKGYNKSLSDHYNITLNGDSAMGHLPYVGRVNAVNMGDNGRVVFNNITTELEIELKKKRKNRNDKKVVSFKVDGKYETYNITMSISQSGNTQVSVNSNNRQTCTYTGRIYPLSDASKK